MQSATPTHSLAWLDPQTADCLIEAARSAAAVIAKVLFGCEPRRAHDDGRVGEPQQAGVDDPTVGCEDQLLQELAPDVKEGARVDIHANLKTRQHRRRHDGACENSPGKDPLRKRYYSKARPAP